jgi:hypothetical protein
LHRHHESDSFRYFTINQSLLNPIDSELVYGLGADITSFLAIYGAIFDGNILSLDPGYSIGGPSSVYQDILSGLGLLGTPQGLSGSQKKHESDASAYRGDLYTSGNDYKVDINRFNEIYALQSNDASPSYDLDVWTGHRKERFLKSKNENPEFFYAPFAGVIASTGDFTFPPRMFSNKSAAYPDNGILDKDILKSFFSINGTDDNLVYTEGYERIPANFYKRAIGNEYTIPLFMEDPFSFASKFPEMFSMGGNTGESRQLRRARSGELDGRDLQLCGSAGGEQSLVFCVPELVGCGSGCPEGWLQ